MSASRITYAPCSNAASDQEMDALLAIYRRAIERYEENTMKEAAGLSQADDLDDVREDQDAHTATSKYSG